ncbi:hypothetical protein C8Q77DRAFT_373489 [Trametes polyzona]|nr:hypothetical protein C8Q77DRAFT_373489 [Trametes polyzona]
MEAPAKALKAVHAALSKSKLRDKKRLVDIAGHVSSHLVLLKLSSLSEQVARKLSSFLRESLTILYPVVGLPALQLAGAILESVYHERLLPSIGSLHRDQQDLWESVLHALLAGVLDYLDTHETKDAKIMIGDALYPSLNCETKTY